MKDTVGKLKDVHVREIWKHEARSFTVWMEGNIDALNEQLGLEIQITERERAAGDFHVDLVGEDENGIVVIENQLEKTDHDHLGKMLTYLSVVGAKTAIWISANPRDEHAKTFQWLNENTPPDVSFYLIKVRGVKVDNSPPAPLFSIEVRPRETEKLGESEKRKLAERHYLRKEFWEQLLEGAKGKTGLFDNIHPRYDHWIGIGGGKSGLALNFTIFKDHGACELYLDKGADSDELNKARFDTLESRKKEIETAFGGPLVWQRLDHRRASRIKTPDYPGGIKDKTSWPEVQEKMIDAMIRLKKALDPYIRKLQ
ncbi:hypothetical protein A3I46_03815 [Candidatus Kaiserbacteria bacterium RIFCSPLOWO2_02_FULL_54_13]|nr:MAG: hypothetical protein A3I46_03815 [Candidatus Kaiserbacteria bacterium RIFCSPLOWO2_02_FULL_54_13]